MNLGELRGEIRDLTDMSGSGFHIDYDLNKKINVSLGKLHNLVNTALGSDYFIQTGSYDIAISSSADIYSISDLNPLKIVSIDLYDGAWHYNCPRAPWGDRNDYQLASPLVGVENIAPFRYILFGNSIRVVPTPTGNYTLKIWYVPKHTDLTSDTDTVNPQLPDDYLEWVIYDVAIKLKIKSEESIQECMLMKKEVEAAIKQDALNRITKDVTYAPNVDNDLYYPFPRYR